MEINYDVFDPFPDHTARLAARDAEIERLKGELRIAVDVCNENTDLKKLVTELADALEAKTSWDDDIALVKRAREATK